MTTTSTRNRDFFNARTNKKDEFYTSLIDIEEEVQFYPGQFEGKVVYCNCDDPRTSNFVHFFSNNFENLGLKRLIASCIAPAYSSDGVDPTHHGLLYEQSKPLQARSARNITPLEGDGNYQSEECLSLLDSSDIVVTNPPFSRFRNFLSLLHECNKHFLILGNLNALTYKEVFPHFKSGTLRYGPSIRSGDREFEVPSSYPLTASGVREDENGRRFIRVKGVRWFTNLTPAVTVPPLTLTKTFDESDYPHYTNYEAIHVSRTKDIPFDYPGAMGVPISFMDKFNPKQFEIIGSSKGLAKPMDRIAEKGSYVPGGPRFYLPNEDGTYRRMYDRIVIRNKSLNSGNREP